MSTVAPAKIWLAVHWNNLYGMRHQACSTTTAGREIGNPNAGEFDGCKDLHQPMTIPSRVVLRIR